MSSASGRAVAGLAVAARFAMVLPLIMGLSLMLVLLGAPPRARAAPEFQPEESRPGLVGRPAPDFTLRALNDENQRLSEHLGEVVLISFWGSWCGPCRQQMPQLDQLYQKYRLAGLTLLSVNLDESAARAAEMARALKISYPVLMDQRKQVSRSYRVNTLPVTVLVDRAGVVRYVADGYQPGQQQQHAEQLRKLLNE